MSPKPQNDDVYQSYLLRCWQEGGEGEANQTWRFALTKVGDDEERLGFTTLWDLFAYLEQRLCTPLAASNERDRSGHARSQHAAIYSLDQG
jgi:hypothetical protein